MADSAMSIEKSTARWSADLEMASKNMSSILHHLQETVATDPAFSTSVHSQSDPFTVLQRLQALESECHQVHNTCVTIATEKQALEASLAQTHEANQRLLDQLSRKNPNMQQLDQEKFAQDSQKVHDLLGGLKASQGQ